MERGLLVADAMVGAALAQDWSHWLEALHEFDARWLSPVLDALRTGRLAAVSLVTSDATRLAQWRATPASLRKFWVKPSLQRLSA